VKLGIEIVGLKVFSDGESDRENDWLLGLAKPKGGTVMPMPKVPIPFKDINQAKKILADYGEDFIHPTKTRSTDEIIKHSVGSNLFRAFRGIDGPSKIYRNWAKENFEFILSNLKSRETLEKYDEFIFELNESLSRRWYEKNENNKSKKLSFGPSIKMVNLLIKTIFENGQLRKDNENIIDFLHIPFDSYSMKPLILIINDIIAPDYKFGIKIPKTVTMNFINTKELYNIILDSVRNICSQSEIPPIIYDYWCWDDKH